MADVALGNDVCGVVPGTAAAALLVAIQLQKVLGLF